MFLGGHPRPRTKWAGQQHSPKVWDLLYMRALSIRNKNELLHTVIKPHAMRILHGRPRILTREVIAVANLPVLFLITFHVSEMTYNVLIGTLNPTHSLTHSLTFNNL